MRKKDKTSKPNLLVTLRREEKKLKALKSKLSSVTKLEKKLESADDVLKAQLLNELEQTEICFAQLKEDGASQVNTYVYTIPCSTLNAKTQKRLSALSENNTFYSFFGRLYQSLSAFFTSSSSDSSEYYFENGKPITVHDFITHFAFREECNVECRYESLIEAFRHEINRTKKSIKELTKALNPNCVINFRSLYRQIIRFLFKNMNDESGADNINFFSIKKLIFIPLNNKTHERNYRTINNCVESVNMLI